VALGTLFVALLFAYVVMMIIIMAFLCACMTALETDIAVLETASLGRIFFEIFSSIGDKIYLRMIATLQ
jgi:hypothetical protein